MGEPFVRFALENNHSCSDVRASLIIYVVAPSVGRGRRTFKLWGRGNDLIDDRNLLEERYS